MGNTVSYKRDYESRVEKGFVTFIFVFIMIVLFGNFMMFRPYTEEVVCTLIDVNEKENIPSIHHVRIGNPRYYWCRYQYEYNDYTYDFYCQQNFYSEVGKQRLALINPNNPSEYVFSSGVVSWKNVMLPFSTNKYKDGTYTEFAKYLQDKYEYDWELNR